MIHYLIKVHQYDYYTGLESQCPEDFGRRYTMYLRRPALADSPYKTNEWPKKLDIRVEVKVSKSLDGSEPSLIKIGGKALDRVLDSFLSNFVKKESDAKHRCTECQKLFKGDEFVKKHLKTKHPEIPQEIMTETLMFNAYVADSGHVDPIRPPPQSGPGTPNNNRQGHGSGFGGQSSSGRLYGGQKQGFGSGGFNGPLPPPPRSAGYLFTGCL